MKDAKILIDALERLVKLKHHKDTYGKTAYYQENQPGAWEMAKHALASYNTDKDCEPEGSNSDLTSVASHSSTVGNSIEKK
jgi:hypothetical protein